MIWTRGGTSIALAGDLYPIQRKSSRRQSWGETETGETPVYNRSDVTDFINLEVRVHKVIYSDFHAFIRSTLGYRTNTFTLTMDDGTSTTVRYWSSKILSKNTSFYLFRYKVTLRVE